MDYLGIDKSVFMFTPYQLHEYITNVRNNNALDSELHRIQGLLVGAEKHPFDDKEKQQANLIGLTQIFRTLLAEKARQKIIQEVRQDYASDTQYTSTRPAHDPTRSVSIWNVLKEKITGSG